MAFYNRADIKQQTEGEKSKRFNRSFWGIAKQAAELQPKIAGDVAKTLYEGATSAVDRVGKGYGEVINEATGGAQKSRNEQSAAQKEDTETIRQLGEKLKKATTDEDKNRYSKAIRAITGIGDEQDAAFQERQAQVAEATDPVKAAAAVGSIGLDVLTAGAGGAVIKGARAAERASEAARVPGAAERAVNTIVNPQGGAQAAKSGAVLGAGYGGLGAVQEEGANVTPLDIAGNATVGAVAGAGIGGLLGSLSGALAKSRGRDVTPMDDIKVAELPFFQASQRLTPEQQTRLKQVLDNDPAMATRALSMTDDEAVKLTDAIIKGPEVKAPKEPASVSENIVPTQEVSANPFQAPERPIANSNTITPGQNPINDLEAAAVSDNPAEYLRSRDAAQTVTPEAPAIAADVPASFAPVDAPTQAKVDALKAESNQTPLQEGLTRLYQTNDSADQASTNYFQDPDRLSNWINGRDDNAELSFVDVPSETVVPLERKPGVFKVAEPARQPAMAAEVTPTADIGEISMKLTPEERAAEALGQVKSSKPKTAKEGELAVIGNVDKKLADEIGLNTEDLDPEVAKAVTYLTQGKVSSDASEKTTKSIGRYLSDSIGYATRTLGEAGARTAESLIRGSKVKSDIKAELRPTMINVQKLSKDISGKTETARIQTGANIVKALEDRANVEKYISDPQTRELYDNIVSVFDNIKQRMIDAGMPVREDYSPWTMLKDYSEAPSYLANGLTDKKTRVVSGNAMERTLDEKPELTNNNILEVLPRYVDGMVNHIAFTPVLDDFADALESVPAYVRANTGQFNDGIKYLNTMLANGISQGSSSTADKWIKGLQNNIYSAFLWNNPKNAAFALTQKLLAAADITPEGRSVAKLFDEDDLKIVNKNIWFGEQTVSGDIAGGADPATRAGEMLRSSGAGELARKFDINRFSEQKSVEAPFRQAFGQGIAQSKAYTEAIAAGKTPKEAIKVALQDPEAVALAERTGNIQVNNTAFGANSLARPEFLRDSSAFKRAITMFMRFPLGVSNYIRDTAQIKDARALDVIQRGDPRATNIANMRGEYKAYLKGLKDVGAAVKDGKGGPDAPTTEVINAHIKLVEDNVKTIDKTIKGLSSLRGPKRVAALSAMWAATAAIQFAWDGMASTTSTALGNEKEAPTIGDSVASTDPTGFSLINPWNQNSKVRGGLNSPLNPINKYGGVNTRTVLNAIPVVGSVNTLSRTLTGGNGISDFIDEKLKGE